MNNWRRIWACFTISVIWILSNLGLTFASENQFSDQMTKHEDTSGVSPLYLTPYHSPLALSTAESMYAYHYSHRSHSSHYSHRSHTSHYSGYSHSPKKEDDSSVYWVGGGAIVAYGLYRFFKK
jgi:hypothetical protein